MARISAMDYLKISAMVLILLDHSFYTMEFSSLIHLAGILGQIGVYIFFFASGFLAGHSLKKPMNGWKYLWGKVVRLYPLYVIAIVISIPIIPWIYQQGWSSVFLTLRQIYIPMDSNLFWFVPAIFLAYALFALYSNHRWLFWVAFILIGQQLVSIGSFNILSYMALFFMGVESKWLVSLKFPESKTVNALSNSTYPMYLFHPVVWFVLLSIYRDPTIFYLVYFPLLMIISVFIQANYNRIVDYLKKTLAKEKGEERPGSKQTPE